MQYNSAFFLDARCMTCPNMSRDLMDSVHILTWLPNSHPSPDGLRMYVDLTQSTCAPIGLWSWFGALSSKLLCSGWMADASFICAVECLVRHAINIDKSNLIQYWGCDQYPDALYSYCLNDLSRIYATQTISPAALGLLFFSFPSSLSSGRAWLVLLVGACY